MNSSTYKNSALISKYIIHFTEFKRVNFISGVCTKLLPKGQKVWELVVTINHYNINVKIVEHSSYCSKPLVTSKK